MRINVFEGARRVALIFAVIVTIVVVLIAATKDPYFSVDYRVAGPDSSPIRTTERCPLEARRHFFTTKTPRGRPVSITLCLSAMSFGEERLVPYKIDESGMIWGATAYSPEVDAYERDLEDSFTFSRLDAQWADSEISKLYEEHLLHALGGLAVALAVFWVLVWAVGWVVRGFAGIPRGRDSRQSDVQ